jgi:hypothetical protein
MMLGEQQTLRPVDVAVQILGDLLREEILLEQLLLEPDRQRLAERGESARRECQVGLEQALELEERLVVEGDVVEIGGLDACLLAAIAHGIRRKIRIVLAPREAFFLGRRDDLAVDDESSRGVVIEGR